jgi:guanidinoacetate N-methyltransferase
MLYLVAVAAASFQLNAPIGSVAQRAAVSMAVDRVGPSPDEITAAQRKNLGCPDYTEEQKNTWKDSEAVYDTDANGVEYLKIQGHPVMESWEHPYMARLAEIATSQGGKVFELGFGMSISANYIQSHPIDEHVICEANKQVAERARKWGKEVAPQKVTVEEGFSWDVAPNLEAGSFDGILYDTYPLGEGKANLHHRDFFDDAYRLLKPGGIFTYFCNEDVDISDEEKAMLDEAGFDVKSEQVPVDTPDDCEYWRAKTIVAPLCIKRAEK